MERRRFLTLLGAQLAAVGASGSVSSADRAAIRTKNVIIVGFGGGTRYTESFGPQGQNNIPFLRNELFPLGTFYSRVYNDGETTHYPATAAILTGCWQNIAQYGGERPAQPTIFEYLRKHFALPANETWMVAQGKGFLTAGYSTHSHYGPDYGAHVVAPRQMLLGTFRQLLLEDQKAVFRDRKKLVRELEKSLGRIRMSSEVHDTESERLPEPPTSGAPASAAAAIPQPFEPARRPSRQDSVPATERFLAETIARFLAESESPRSSDALNSHVAREIMARYAPSLLVVNLGEIDVAHQGSFSLYSRAIRNADRQVWDLWQHVHKLPAYRDKTVFIVVPDHGRNLDGLGMNGFQHHRGGDDG